VAEASLVDPKEWNSAIETWGDVEDGGVGIIYSRKGHVD
jgi:hypothetical protein